MGAKINKAKIPNGWRILFEGISSKLSISTNMSSVGPDNIFVDPIYCIQYPIQYIGLVIGLGFLSQENIGLVIGLWGIFTKHFGLLIGLEFLVI